jgi:hypothetical protein
MAERNLKVFIDGDASDPNVPEHEQPALGGARDGWTARSVASSNLY